MTKGMGKLLGVMDMLIILMVECFPELIHMSKVIESYTSNMCCVLNDNYRLYLNQSI